LSQTLNKSIWKTIHVQFLRVLLKEVGEKKRKKNMEKLLQSEISRTDDEREREKSTQKIQPKTTS